jgi:hypothetical protein
MRCAGIEERIGGVPALLGHGFSYLLFVAFVSRRNQFGRLLFCSSAESADQAFGHHGRQGAIEPAAKTYAACGELNGAFDHRLSHPSSGVKEIGHLGGEFEFRQNMLAEQVRVPIRPIADESLREELGRAQCIVQALARQRIDQTGGISDHCPTITAHRNPAQAFGPKEPSEGANRIGSSCKRSLEPPGVFENSAELGGTFGLHSTADTSRDVVFTWKQPNVAVKAGEKLDTHDVALTRDIVSRGRHEIWRSEGLAQSLAEWVANPGGDHHVGSLPRRTERTDLPMVACALEADDAIADDLRPGTGRPV